MEFPPLDIVLQFGNEKKIFMLDAKKRMTINEAIIIIFTLRLPSDTKLISLDLLK